jgi:hypothetical protein
LDIELTTVSDINFIGKWWSAAFATTAQDRSTRKTKRRDSSGRQAGNQRGSEQVVKLTIFSRKILKSN